MFHKGLNKEIIVESAKEMIEKDGDAAIEAVAEGYRKFAKEHIELYRFIMQIPAGNNEVLREAAAVTAEPFMKVHDDYRISDSRKMHWQRVLRGVMHGFISEEQWAIIKTRFLRTRL